MKLQAAFLIHLLLAPSILSQANNSPLGVNQLDFQSKEDAKKAGNVVGKVIANTLVTGKTARGYLSGFVKGLPSIILQTAKKGVEFGFAGAKLGPPGIVLGALVGVGAGLITGSLNSFESAFKGGVQGSID